MYHGYLKPSSALRGSSRLATGYWLYLQAISRSATGEIVGEALVNVAIVASAILSDLERKQA